MSSDALFQAALKAPRVCYLTLMLVPVIAGASGGGAPLTPRAMANDPILESIKFGDHNKRLFHLRSTEARGEPPLWKKKVAKLPNCLYDGDSYCAIGKPCEGGICGLHNSIFHAVARALKMEDGVPVSVSRFFEGTWWDMIEVRKIAALRSLLVSNETVSTGYGAYPRKAFYKLAQCKANCPLEPHEFLKLAMIDFICQNHDRLNRLKRMKEGKHLPPGDKDDNLVHIFVNPSTMKFAYVDNECPLRTPTYAKWEKYSDPTNYGVDKPPIDERAFEIFNLFNATTKAKLITRHIGSAPEFRARLADSLNYVHPRPLNLTNLETRVEKLLHLLHIEPVKDGSEAYKATIAALKGENSRLREKLEAIEKLVGNLS